MNAGFIDLAAADQLPLLYKRALQRIQAKVEEFLSPPEALETSMRILRLALEVDENIDRILRDSLVREFYEYDGQFFTPKCGWGFYRSFDGTHILRSLSDSMLDTFFRGRDRRLAIQWLIEELEKHSWEAEVRRLNWEESGTLSVVPQAVLDEILRHTQCPAGSATAGTPLSSEERIFFRSFEHQMDN